MCQFGPIMWEKQGREQHVRYVKRDVYFSHMKSFHPYVRHHLYVDASMNGILRGYSSRWVGVNPTLHCILFGIVWVF
jgi:hypothetical protein